MPGSVKRDVSLTRYRKKECGDLQPHFFQPKSSSDAINYQTVDATRMCPLFFNGVKITREQLLEEIEKQNKEAKDFLELHLHQASYLYSTRRWITGQLDKQLWAFVNNPEDSELHFSLIDNQLRVTEVCQVKEAMPSVITEEARSFIDHEKNVYLTETHRHAKGMDDIYKPKGGIAYFETTYITTFPEEKNKTAAPNTTKHSPKTILYDVSITRQDKQFCALFFPDDRKILTKIRDFFMALLGKHISRKSAIPKPAEDPNAELASQSLMRP